MSNLELTAEQKRMMAIEAAKEAQWTKESGYNMGTIEAEAEALSIAPRRVGPNGRKQNGSSRGGKIAAPTANGGGKAYHTMRLQRVG